MPAEVSPPSAKPLDMFRQRISLARRKAGHLQKELAAILGVDSHVLSRKMHGQAQLTYPEIKQIIKTLASWDAIATWKEAVELLALMDLTSESFSSEEWNSPPLNRLKRDKHEGRITHSASYPTIQPMLPLTKQKLYELATRLFEESLALYEACGSLPEKAEAFFELGERWLQQGKYAEARYCYETYLRIHDPQCNQLTVVVINRLKALALLQEVPPQAQEKEIAYEASRGQ
jgi:tetratricopeptide (TPR) repeat protein